MEVCGRLERRDVESVLGEMPRGTTVGPKDIARYRVAGRVSGGLITGVGGI